MIERKTIEKIEFKNLSYELNSEVKIFESIDFQFPLKGVVWIKSEAGAGKSSLFRIIDGLSFASEGEYKINNLAVSELSFEEFNHYRLNIGYSFDFGGLINNRTLHQNLSLPLEYHNIFTPEERDHKVRIMLRTFGIESEAEKRPSAVPGTIRKAMCVARAFIHEPQLILLDDPTTGLRGHIKKQLKVLVQDHIKKNPKSVIFIATEDEKFVADMADCQIELKKGSLEMKNLKEQAA